MSYGVLKFSRSGAYTTQEWGDELNYTVSQNATFPSYSRVTECDIQISAGLVSGTSSARTCYIGVQLECNGNWYTVLSDHAVSLGGSATTGAVNLWGISIPEDKQLLFGLYGITGICITQDGDFSIRGKAGSGTATFTYLDGSYTPTLNSSYPQNATIVKGNSTTLSVVVSSAGYPNSYSYQWYKDGVAISGATGSSFNAAPTSTATYYCEVSNYAGTVTSRTATVTVNYLPVLNSSYPQDATIIKGNSTTLSASISTAGNPNSYTYQWYKGCSAISGATSSSLEVSPSSTSTYYCRVTNAAGSVDTRTATVTVNYVPVLNSSYPQNATIIKGNSTKLSVAITTAGNPNSYTYQWYNDSGAISGATGSELTVSPNSTASYYCKVTNAAGTVTSRKAIVTVNYVPVLNSGLPNDISATPNTSVTLSVEIATAGNPNSYTYQWYKNGVAISGATSSTLNITTPTFGADTYYCAVTNAAGTVNSRTATTASQGAAAIKTADGIKTAIAYIYHDGAYCVAIPYVYSNGEWKPSKGG